MNRKVKKKAFIMKVRFITFRATASKWLTKRQGFTDKHIKTTTCPQKGGVSRTSSFLNYTGKKVKKAKSPQMVKNRFCIYPLPENL